MFAVFPAISLASGDQRRNNSPYFIAGGVSYADLNTANSAMRFLKSIGIPAYLDVIVEKI